MRRIRPGKRHLQQDSEGGAAAVEFALVIPVLLLVLCGVFDFGNLYMNWNIVDEAARQGARLASVNPGETSAQITAALSSYASQLPGGLTVTENPNPSTSGSNVTVTVTSSVTIMTPIIRAFFPSNPVSVTGQCTMLVEQP